MGVCLQVWSLPYRRRPVCRRLHSIEVRRLLRFIELECLVARVRVYMIVRGREK
jgi:hypothetical protein